MAIKTVQIRSYGDEVYIVTNDGIVKGTVGNRTIDSEDEVVYSIKIGGKYHYIKKKHQHVFEDSKSLIKYYESNIKE